MASKSLEYLEEIRRAEGLSRAVLKKICVEGGEAVFHLVTDKNYSQEDVAYASEVSRRYASGFNASARVVKSVPGEEGVKKAIADFLRLRFPAFAAFVSPEDIAVDLDGSGGRFFIGVSELERTKGMEDGVADAVAAELNRSFCGTWTGELRAAEKERGEIELGAPPPEEYILAPRFFEICNYAPLDGAAPKHAIYIADLEKEMQGVTVCGVISLLEERESKNGRPYFTFAVNDATGSMRARYFPRKATYEKVRTLSPGTSVCLTGDNEFYNDNLTFRIKSIDYGEAPAGFVPEERPSRPVPARYRTVFPAPVSDFVQADLFGAAPLPEAFVKGRFVVFDLETTGLNNTPGTGAMDRIIEVGAVKIENGAISEKFSTFVACPVKLSSEIVDLTGISDNMLVGAPKVGEVLADFYKFTAGCVLVGHNVTFDTRFIRFYGEKDGYFFGQREIDTVTFAQAMLRLSNYKLNTVADHFGFTFNHHRAYDDAFVTAKIFIELVRMKGGLPF